MNAKERIFTTLNLEEPDRVPLYEGGLENVAIAKHFGETPPTQGLRKYMRVMSRVLVGWRFWFKWAMRRSFVIKAGLKRLFRFYKKVGLDLAVAPCTFLLTKCAFPTWDTYVDEWGRKFKIDVYNGADQLVYEDGYFKDKADYEAWGLPDPAHPMRVKNVKFALKYAGDDLCVAAGINGVMEATWESFGFERFSMMLFRERKFIREVFASRAKFALETMKMALDEGVELVLMLDDLAYKGRTFFSPKMMDQYVWPHYRRIVNAAHKRGAKILLHSCGDLTDIFGQLVDVGFDGINPIEPTAGMDIFALKEQYGDKVTFIGNVSPQDLATGTPEAIRAYTKQLLARVAPGGGFILASGHSINPYVAKENYLAMLEVARKWGEYPIRLEGE